MVYWMYLLGKSVIFEQILGRVGVKLIVQLKKTILRPSDEQV
jgi:hypothetical protein